MKHQKPSNQLHFALRGWILVIALIAVLAARIASDAPLRPAWLLLLLAGIVLRAWAGAHLGVHGNAARAQASMLATSGPYRFSRNPLYVSNILVGAGLVFYANALPLAGATVFVIAIVIHHALLVRHEERALAGMFGDAYDAYRLDVPRWVGISNAQKREHGKRGAALRDTGVRQGRNVGYALLAALSVWIAARWF